jgi:uroporphyrinogen III methyltransferase/synthase
MERLRRQGLDARALADLRICCIGPRTSRELTSYGLQADVIPSEYQAEGIIDALSGRGMDGQRILIPRARVAREILPEQLRAAGAAVDVVPVYQTVRPHTEVASLCDLLAKRSVDMLTFTSSSTVTNFVELFAGPEQLREAIGDTPVACIGPITAATAREHGMSVQVMPTENTVPAMADAIVRFFTVSVESANA